jgi:protein involved in polysaccharide export with SLBB domain
MALLSDGEYVVNARSTRAFRPLLETINSAQNLPAFAAGGLVNQGSTPFKSQNETIADAVSTAFGQTPIKTYVTATEVSNQQQFDRIIKSRSLI